jgi:hypothetical protein
LANASLQFGPTAAVLDTGDGPAKGWTASAGQPHDRAVLQIE